MCIWLRCGGAVFSRIDLILAGWDLLPREGHFPARSIKRKMAKRGRSRKMFLKLRLGLVVMAVAAGATAQTTGPANWQNDLTPIGAADWNYDFAEHLLERAGFGGTPEEIQALAKLTPQQAVARVVRFERGSS